MVRVPSLLHFAHRLGSNLEGANFFFAQNFFPTQLSVRQPLKRHFQTALCVSPFRGVCCGFADSPTLAQLGTGCVKGHSTRAISGRQREKGPEIRITAAFIILNYLLLDDNLGLWDSLANWRTTAVVVLLAPLPIHGHEEYPTRGTCNNTTRHRTST